MPLKKDEYDPEEWDIVATKRINKYIDMNKVKNYEDYHQELLTLFMQQHDRTGRFTGRNIINSNRTKRKFDDITRIMYDASIEKGQIIERKKRQFLFLYGVFEVNYEHTSSKGKKYVQTQWQNTRGVFVKNPYK